MIYTGSCTQVRITGRWARCTLYDSTRIKEFKLKQAALKQQGYYVNPLNDEIFITNALVPYHKAPEHIKRRIEYIVHKTFDTLWALDSDCKMSESQLVYWTCFCMVLSDIPGYIKEYFKWAAGQGARLDCLVENVLYDPKADRLVFHDLLYQE